LKLTPEIGATTVSIKAFNKMILSMTTLGMILGITTLRIPTFSITMCEIQYSAEWHSIQIVVMRSVLKLSFTNNP
jgi:hypothetical protein